MSPVVMSFIESALIPAAVVALLCLGVSAKSEPWRSRLQSMALALGFMGGAFILVRGLSFPPHDVNESFSWAALLLAIFVWISPRASGSRYVVRALFVVGMGLLSLYAIRESLNGSTQMRNLMAFFFLALGTWSIAERAAQSVQTLTLLVLPLISATALSLLLLFKGSASMSQLVSILCSLLGALAAVTLLFPKRISVAAVLPFVSVFLVLFMAAGHFYLDINPWHMIYLCLPFLLLWIREWFGFIPRKALVEVIVFGLLSLAPLAYFIYDSYQTAGPLY